MNPTDRVREALKPFGADDRVVEFDVSTATVELAAAAIGCGSGHIAKTLSFMVGDQPVFVVAAGDRRVDNGKFKRRFATKARMMTAEELRRHADLSFGGVCPFALPPTVQVWLDESLRGLDPVYPAAGTEHSVVRLSVDELERFSHARGWVDVCKERAPA